MYHMAQESAFPAQYSYPAHPYTTPSELSSETLPPPSTCPSYKKPSAYNPQTYIQCLRYDSDSKRFPPWSSGIKGIGMSLYLKMCEAVGKGDVEVLKTVCSDERLAELLKIIEKRNPKTIYDWRVDSVVRPNYFPFYLETQPHNPVAFFIFTGALQNRLPPRFARIRI